MFNMKTSDLFKRAKQLADLEGSDFISWNEAISCINESNVGLYEKLINMGDNSFVRSFRTTEEEMELPSDFWQLKGVFLWNNGNLQTINRRADNNGTHHLSYELRNGKLYLFGKPNDVLVEYFPKPQKLFFKPHDVAISLEAEIDSETKQTKYVDCYKHTFLMWTEIYGESHKKLSIIDLDGVKSKEDILPSVDNPSSSKGYITDHYVFTKVNEHYVIYDILTGYSASTPDFYQVLVTESGKEYIVDIIGYHPSIYTFSINSNGTLNKTKVGETYYSNNDFLVSNNDLTDLFYIGSGYKLYHNDEKVSDINFGNNCKMVYQGGSCYVLGNQQFYIFDKDNNLVYSESTGINIGFIGIDERTGYGYCSKKYGSFYVCPYCEDTPLNYPNSTYFQIISYILAIAFKSKQGADISLLQNQLEMVTQTFEETLGSDAFQFPRMGNVYN